MRPPPLQAVLATGPLLCDGAMGTELYARGLSPGESPEGWNVSAPDRIEEVHRSYALAGCRLLTTNTFGGTAIALARHGLADRAAGLNRAGAEIARRVAGPDRWVLGDIGPLGDLLEPLGGITFDQAFAAFRDQAAMLLDGGADAILVETMSDPAEAVAAIGAAREAGAPIVFATFAWQKTPDGFRTMMGTPLEVCLAEAVRAGAAVVGANCGTGLTLGDYAEIARRCVAAAAGHPVMVQPNAGAPILRDGQAVYEAAPEQMARAAREFVTAGARVIGGCCGTTPAHLAAMGRALAGAPIGAGS